MIFETERLLIRPLAEADLEGFHDLQSNPKVMQYTGGQVTNRTGSEKELQEVIAAYSKPDNDFWVWAVIRKPDSVFLGTCALIVNEEGEKELGYRLREAHWGNGYGHEVTKGLIRFGLEQLGLSQIVAYVYPANRASVRILERHMLLEKEFFNEAAQSLDRKYVVHAESPNSSEKLAD